MRPLRRFLALPREQRRLALRAVWLLVYARVVLGMRGMAPFRNRLSGGAANPGTSGGHPDPRTDWSEDAARLVSAVQRNLPGHWSCLHAALALTLLLEENALQPVLRIGALKDSALFQAHAWVELNGVVLIGGHDAPERYVVFPRPA